MHMLRKKRDKKKHRRGSVANQVGSLFANGNDGTGLRAKGVYGVLMFLLILLSMACFPLAIVLWVARRRSATAQPTEAVDTFRAHGSDPELDGATLADTGVAGDKEVTTLDDKS
jgi:hypothetical protein